MNLTTVGIDLAKHVFQLHGMDAHGKPVVKKRLPRDQLLPFLAQLPGCRVGVEACGGAHYWARQIKALGHDVRLISPQFVKPYMKSHKNDANDAEAICEAVSRESMRFVPIKSLEQQDLQALHRVREQLVKSRTALVNQIRGLLNEYGIIIPQGIHHLRGGLPAVLENAENGLSDLMREVIAELYERLRSLEEQVVRCERRLERIGQQDERCRRLMAVEGVGPLIATALVAAVGTGLMFANGRQLAAWLGLVPRQHSSGGKTVLLGIHKRGNRYLRRLLIHGARSVIHHAEGKTDRRSQWLQGLRARKGTSVTAVALANKNARVLWTLLARGDTYRKAA